MLNVPFKVNYPKTIDDRPAGSRLEGGRRPSGLQKTKDADPACHAPIYAAKQNAVVKSAIARMRAPLPPPAPEALTSVESNQLIGTLYGFDAANPASQLSVMYAIIKLVLQIAQATQSAAQASRNSEQSAQIRELQGAADTEAKAVQERFAGAMAAAVMGTIVGVAEAAGAGFGALHSMASGGLTTEANRLASITDAGMFDMSKLTTQLNDQAKTFDSIAAALGAGSKAADSLLGGVGNSINAAQASKAGGLDVQKTNQNTEAAKDEMQVSRSRDLYDSAGQLTTSVLRLIETLNDGNNAINSHISKNMV